MVSGINFGNYSVAQLKELKNNGIQVPDEAIKAAETKEAEASKTDDNTEVKYEVADDASAGYLLPDDKQLTIDRDGAMLVAEMHNSKLPDNPPTGASEDSFTQTAVIIISMIMMSAAVMLVFPLSKRKRKR